jgi:hypothetical protein
MYHRRRFEPQAATLHLLIIEGVVEISAISDRCFPSLITGRRGRMLARFTTIYVISSHHH